MKSPAETRQEWGEWFAAFPTKPVMIQETRYATSAANASANAAQAGSVRVLFSAWKEYETRIQLLNFVWLNDLSESQAQGPVGDYGGLVLTRI